MSPRAGSCTPRGVRRGALTHPSPRDTALAKVWPLPGPSQTPAFFASRPPDTGTNGEVAISSTTCKSSRLTSGAVESWSMIRRICPKEPKCD